MRNISILRIIKNKIGYKRPIICVCVLLLSTLYFIFFRNFIIEITLTIFLFLYILYFIIFFVKEILKINYYFKYGIETIAYVQKDTYALPFNTSFQVALINKIYFPGENDKEEIKNGVCYRYNINGEIYESKYNFNDNNETLFIKEGSKINILANPKNKNETIIKDLFIKL